MHVVLLTIQATYSVLHVSLALLTCHYESLHSFFSLWGRGAWLRGSRTVARVTGSSPYVLRRLVPGGPLSFKLVLLPPRLGRGPCESASLGL